MVKKSEKAPRASQHAGDPGGEDEHRQQQPEADDDQRLVVPCDGLQTLFCCPGSSRRRLRHTRVLRRGTKKAPASRGLLIAVAAIAYFSDELIEVNLVFSVPPSVLTMAMIASEMPAAI